MSKDGKSYRADPYFLSETFKAIHLIRCSCKKSRILLYALEVAVHTCLFLLGLSNQHTHTIFFLCIKKGQQMIGACNHGKVISVARPWHIDVPHVVIMDKLEVINFATEAADSFCINPCESRFSETLLGVSQMRVQSYNLFLKSPNHTKLLNINILQVWHTFCCIRTSA